MPTQRAHGGAALIPISLTSPGAFGLNTEASGTLLPKEWATTLTNAVFDSSGRPAARKGWVTQTSSAVAGVLMRVHEYVKADGTVKTISSTDADIFEGVSTPSSVEGSLAISEGNIKFVNFNDKCIALGTGTSANPSVYTGTGNFTTVTVASGTAPTSGIGTAAFGRLWVVDSDGKTIRYSALIDETKWAVADGGGTIDMSKVWPRGQDVVVAIEEFAGDLVVFGRNQVVVWTDGQGTSNGIDPVAMYIADTIPGVGALTQFALASIKGDLWFLSRQGVQSMSRVLQDKTTPTINISQHIQQNILDAIASETLDDITLVYSPKEDLALAIFPTTDLVYAFDTRAAMQDGTYRATSWATTLQTAAFFPSDGELYGSITGTVGEIMKHSTNADDGTAYTWSYESGWLDFGEQGNSYLKFIKRMTSVVFVSSTTTLNYTLDYDFKGEPFNIQQPVVARPSAEFNVAEFSDSGSGVGYIIPGATVLQETEYGGGVTLKELSIPGKGSGQFVKVGVNLGTASADFALQQINLYAKIGRIS